MTSSNGHIFHFTGSLWGESTGPRWIPLTKTSDAELWCFLGSAPETNGIANNRGAGDLRRHRAYCDVTVISIIIDARCGPDAWRNNRNNAQPNILPTKRFRSFVPDDIIKWKHFPSYWPFITGEFPAQRPVTRSFYVSLICTLNKRLNKSRGWWFDTPSRSLWRHRNVLWE